MGRKTIEGRMAANDALLRFAVNHVSLQADEIQAILDRGLTDDVLGELSDHAAELEEMMTVFSVTLDDLVNLREAHRSEGVADGI